MTVFLGGSQPEIPKHGHSKRSRMQKSAKERKKSASKHTKERKWAQKGAMSAEERLRVKIANNQVWELPRGAPSGNDKKTWNQGLQEVSRDQSWIIHLSLAAPKHNKTNVLGAFILKRGITEL